VHLRSQEADLAGTAFTADADIGIDTRQFADEPLVEEAMRGAGFEIVDHRNPGTWERHLHVGDVADVSVKVDLLVPEMLAGRGRRSAEVPPHDPQSFRRVEGIETAIIDNSPIPVSSLEPDDGRTIVVNVAGIPALLVSKGV
jgi:hypothetical protein